MKKIIDKGIKFLFPEDEEDVKEMRRDARRDEAEAYGSYADVDHTQNIDDISDEDVEIIEL
jgi:hypothetical protein